MSNLKTYIQKNIFLNSNKNRNILLTIPGAFILIFLLFILVPDFMQVMELKIQDLFFKLRYRIKGAEQESRLLRYFNLDNRDIQELNVKNDDRTIFAEAIEALAKAGSGNIM